MKAEHRHELKTNELAEWIINFPQWARKNAGMIIYISVLAVVVAAVYFWKVYEKKAGAEREQIELTVSVARMMQNKLQIVQARAQNMDASYTLIQAADDFQRIARNTKDDQTAALALIKQAESLRAEGHYRSESVSGADLTVQINRAKDCYTKAIEKAQNNPSLLATAEFGLGLCEEELGNLKQAREIYAGVAENADFQGTIAAAQADQRLRTMADYQQKIVFKPSPKLLPAPTIQPEIKLEAPKGPNYVGAAEPNLPSQ
jgi:tetratricopeptide (TPR) repeat protein